MISLLLMGNRFLFKFTGKEEEINLLGDGSEKPEFNEWRWMFPEQVLERVRKPCGLIFRFFSPFCLAPFMIYLKELFHFCLIFSKPWAGCGFQEASL